MTEEKSTVVETPLMKQYNEIKAQYPDALLLFRVGDFYETFGSDAIAAARILGITLTKRKNGAAAFIELAGFPHHSLDTYLPKLVRAGNRVAICDQLEDPKLTKKIVKRGVTELVTPAVSYNEKTFDSSNNQFLAAVVMRDQQAGVSFLDISTGEFYLAEGSTAHINKLLQSFRPNEVLFQKHEDHQFREAFGDTKWFTFRVDEWVFSLDYAKEVLQKQFGTQSLKGFGVEELKLGVIAAGAVLHYLKDTQHDKTQHIQKIARIEEDTFVWLDRFTIRNLELVHSNYDETATLFYTLNHTSTPMGARLLRRWVLMPLKDIAQIEKRQFVVGSFVKNAELLAETRLHLNTIGDMERLASKIATGRVNPREMLQLAKGMQTAEHIKDLGANSKSKEIQALFNVLKPLTDWCNTIFEKINPEAPLALNRGSVIAEGVNADLDELRNLQKSGKDYLQMVQERESERTGIPSLKIAFNNVFGYYLEVRNTHKDKVPPEWIRKQTVTQAERYITPELKEYEAKITGAEDKISILENQIYQALIEETLPHLVNMQLNARVLAEIDTLASFATAAVANKYCAPEFTEENCIEIEQGRHAIIELRLPPNDPYIANDIKLDRDAQQIMMITGPNMSGKSAVLRQTALIVLMAQMGSFVPAKRVRMGIVDKVFTRVGANDNMSAGESTFMVEMNETASILNNLSDRSLILLDEIGRGTSTYDGVSIAWAIAEFLHEHPQFRAKTLFATHYHELNDMTNLFPRIKNFNVSVSEAKGKIVFRRKLQEGGSNHSFGIHVAQLAGMPKTVVNRANDMLHQLETKRGEAPVGKGKTAVVQGEEKMQLSFFQLDDPTLVQIKKEVEKIDINTLTPVEALFKLNEIKKIVGS
jgi:DNA mismatch repair protein MutS